ncbi:MAG: dihydrodipicolinate synthase family protein, partial [Chloroflexi bacterium]|nr:dihydrodipicolinate synthase family protein [Chloroflexota bacterium]
VTRGRVPVVVGVSADVAREAGDNARVAEQLGAAGVMTLPPLSYRADDEEIVRFFRSVADATDLPLMIYNNPSGSKNDLRPSLVAQLFEIDRIVAVKETSEDVRRISAILELTGDEMEVLVGGDDWALEGFAAGATGWVSGCADVAPRESVALYESIQAGDMDGARRIYRRLLPLARLDMDPKLVQLFKAALDEIGRYGGPSRPPRLPLTRPEVERVQAAVARLVATPDLQS